MRRFAVLSVLIGGAVACSVVTNLDDLRRGTTDGGNGTDGGVDGAPPSDGGTPDGGVPACNPGTVADLVGYYNFDEGSGAVAHDCSGKGHDGTILRVVAGTWSTGIKGGGLRVVGSDGCVDLGNVADFEMKASGLTVMAWANTVNYPSNVSNAIVGKSSDLNVSGWRMYAGFIQELGAGAARPGDGGALFVGKEPLPAAVWNHVAAVLSPGSQLTFYIDGQNVSAKPWPSAAIEDKASNVRIGCRSDNTGFYDGTIDEVRIYARALTPTEIAILSAKP